MARDVRRPGWWDDDCRTPRPCGLVDGDRVRGGVSGDAHERALDRSEQIEGGGRIITRLLGQRVDTDHAGLIDAKVELPPATPAAATVFRGRPLTLPDDGQTCAVKHEMDALVGRARSQTAPQMLTAPGERRIVGGGEIKAHHPEQGVQEAFGLAQREMGEEPQGQGGLDGEIRVAPLPTPPAAPAGRPASDRLRGQPHRHIAASNECAVVGRPVRNAVLRLVPGMDLRLHPCSVAPAEGPEKCGPRRPTRPGPSCNNALHTAGCLARVTRVRVHLYGSLAATGRGHGSHKALMLGLEGETAEATDIDRLPARIAAITAERRLTLLGQHAIPFDPAADIIFERRERLPGHPNGMRFIALADDSVLEDRIYYSVGGGFVASADDAGRPLLIERDTPLPLPFTSAETLLALCERHGLAISDVMLRNERAWRPEADVRAGLLAIWEAMRQCVTRGCEREGQLPGLQVERRAATLHQQLTSQPDASLRDPLTIMDWVNLYALAVNEENATGCRVVTAPTNGAAGIVPAVLHYYARFCAGADDDGVVRCRLTAGAIGLLFKA